MEDINIKSNDDLIYHYYKTVFNMDLCLTETPGFKVNQLFFKKFFYLPSSLRK